jgi:predicted nucleic acid-binding protein
VILADTSVWVDYLRSRDFALANLMRKEPVLMHPFVMGELALGYLNPREHTLAELRKLVPARVARDSEVRSLIESGKLYGTGIGYVDAHLLASVRLTPGSSLWTRDKRLHEVAKRLGVAANI